MRSRFCDVDFTCRYRLHITPRYTSRESECARRGSRENVRARSESIISPIAYARDSIFKISLDSRGLNAIRRFARSATHVERRTPDGAQNHTENCRLSCEHPSSCSSLRLSPFSFPVVSFLSSLLNNPDGSFLIPVLRWILL